MLYLDSSAIVKIIKTEKDVPSLIKYLDESNTKWVSSELIRLEVIRTTYRLELSVQDKTLALDLIFCCELINLNSDILKIAEKFDIKKLGTLDSIHLSTAVYCNAKDFLTYDKELINSCSKYNLNAITPK